MRYTARLRPRSAPRAGTNWERRGSGVPAATQSGARSGAGPGGSGTIAAGSVAVTAMAAPPLFQPHPRGHGDLDEAGAVGSGDGGTQRLGQLLAAGYVLGGGAVARG